MGDFDTGRQTPEQPRSARGDGAGESLVTRGRHARFVERPYTYVDAIVATPDAAGGDLIVTGSPPERYKLLARYAAVPGVRFYLDGHYPVVRLDDVTIRWAGQWWGNTAGPALCDRAHRFLVDELRRGWDAPVGLLATPGTTGRDLWARTIPAGRSYPVLSAHAQDLIRATAHQGRFETLPRPAGVELPATVRLFDARIAYSACLRGLPVGEPELVDIGRRYDVFDVSGDRGFDPWQPARYRVGGFRAPDGWRLPGILPVAGTPWTYPAAYDAAGDGGTWVDGAELHLALVHGWTVDVLDALVFPGRADVFRTWADRLGRILTSPRLARAALDEPRLPGVVRHAVRAMLLHTVGAMHARPYKRTLAGDPDAIPDGAGDVRMIGSELASWSVEQPPAWPQMAHPEWSSAVWARARTRLLSVGTAGALNLPAGTVVGFRTDAILTTAAPDWPDDGRPGQYVAQGATQIDRWPANNAETLEIAKQCRINRDGGTL
jgi:hypothetical protein